MDTRKSSFVTSYDVIKSFALLLMIIDHLGYYFFPDNEWFRVLGRMCVPIWCFLIGYANSRDLSFKIWISAGLIILACFIFGGIIFPLNMLVSIIIIRLVIDKICQYAFKNYETLVFVILGLVFLYLPTMIAFEYGSAGIILAMAGYIMRHGSGGLIASQLSKIVFFCTAISLFTASQILTFDLTFLQLTIMVLGVGFVSICLYKFKPSVYTFSVPNLAEISLKFMGRHSLEIYVFHLILFKFICAFNGWHSYGWMAWSWLR